MKRRGMHDITEARSKSAVRASRKDLVRRCRYDSHAPARPLKHTTRVIAALVWTLVTLIGLRPAGPTQAASTGGLQEVSIKSTALKALTTVEISLPAGYADGTRRYPVLYLYHGLGGSNKDWIYNTDIEKLTQNVPVIVVMPEADMGWYANPANPRANSPHWEDYHVGELISFIDSHYRTIATRAGRAVAGLSMGGMGAFSYAARHPDLFIAAASFSGALDLRLETDNVGSPSKGLWFWSGHNPVELAGNLAGLTVYLASGNGSPGSLDPAGTAFDDSEANKLVEFKHMVTALHSSQVPATLDAFGPGTHTFPYFERDLHRALPLIMATFAHPPSAPAPWGYRTTEPRFDVWGYHGVRLSGSPSWTILTAVSRDGLSVSGAGSLMLRTAALYKPRGIYLVTGPSSSSRIQADSTGRLRLTLLLVPGIPQHWAIDAAQS